MSVTWTSELALRVPWGCCDPAGIVHFSHWFRWCDLSTWHFFESARLSIPEMIRRYGTVGLPIVSVGGAVRAPTRAHEHLKVETTIGVWARKTLELRHRFRRDDAPVFEGSETRAWVVPDAARPSGLRAVEIPEEVAAHFARLARERSAGPA